jgi:hypothetical protein
MDLAVCTFTYLFKESEIRMHALLKYKRSNHGNVPLYSILDRWNKGDALGFLN